MENRLTPIDSGDLRESQGAPAQNEAELYEILVRQAQGYTRGESSSVPVETAQELLRSIRFCIDLCDRPAGEMPLVQRWEAGMQKAWRQAEACRELYVALRGTANPFGNVAFGDTLDEIGRFFARYDYRYLAHQIPCMIDYQLCRPVPEALQGILYIREYLVRLALENRFCAAFAPERVQALLEVCCRDHRGLLVNLFEPVLVSAVGLSLLEKDAAGLSHTGEDRGALADRFRRWRGEEGRAEREICGAVERLCGALRVGEARAASYCRDCALGALPRIRACAPAGWNNLFPTLP